MVGEWWFGGVVVWWLCGLAMSMWCYCGGYVGGGSVMVW